MNENSILKNTETSKSVEMTLAKVKEQGFKK